MRSNGPIKNLAQVRSLARTLQSYARIPREQDMAKLALRSPKAFLARPTWQGELVDAAEGAEQEAIDLARTGDPDVHDGYNLSDSGLGCLERP